MAYYDKDYFLGSPAGFEGTFTELDGELVYITPAGKQGTVNVSVQYREDDGTALVDDSGNPLPSFTDTISVAGTPAVTSDVLELAIPDGQIVTNTAFTVEVISENYDSSAVSAPKVDGVAMTQSQLQYPGTSINSVQVWSLDVTLTANQLNTLTITGGPSSVSLNVTHKSSLTSVTVANVSDARTALENAANDEVVFNYAEADLIKNVLNGRPWPTAKASYTTIRAGTGSITLPNDTADGTTAYAVNLPASYLLRIQGAAIGSSTDDGGGGTMVLDGSQAGVWFDQCTFTQKYNLIDYPNYYDVPYSAAVAQGDMNHTSYPKTKTGGRDCLFTGCTFTGWGFKGCTVRDILVRDCILEETRGDINNNGRLILNNRNINPAPIWVLGGADGTHMDIYQCSTQTGGNPAGGSFLIGFRVEVASSNGYEGQAIIISGSNPAETSIDGVIIDNLDITGPQSDSALLAQFAQGVSNARFSNIDLNGSGPSIRRDLASPFSAGENVYFKNFSARAYRYVNQSGTGTVLDSDGTDVASSWETLINNDKTTGESDVSVLSAVVDNPIPTGDSFFGGPSTNTALIYQSVLSPGSGQGQLDVSVLPSAFADVIRFNVRNAGGNTPQMRAYFDNQTDRDAFLAAVTDVIMTVNGLTYGFAASGWSNVTGEVIVCVPTGDAWPTAVASNGLWGDGTAIVYTMAEASSASAQFTGTWDASGTTVTNLTAVANSGALLDDLTATGSSADKFFANSNSGGGLRLQDVSPYVPNSTTTLEVVAALTSAPGTTVTGSPLLYSGPQGSNSQKFLYLTASSFVDVASLAGISDGDSITLTVTRTIA